MVVEGSANKQIRGGKPRKSWSGLAWSAAIKFNARRPSRRTTFDPSSYGNSIHCFALVSLASRRRLERSFHGYDGWSKSNFLFNLDENEDRLTRGTETNDGRLILFLEWIFKDGRGTSFRDRNVSTSRIDGIKRQFVRSKIQRLNGDRFCLFVCVYGLVCLRFTLVCFRSRRIRFHPPRIPNAEFVNIRFRNDTLSYRNPPFR